MLTHKIAAQAALLAAASCFLTACGKDSAGGTDTQNLNVALPPAPQVEITANNYVDVASSALKAILLSDVSAAALDKAVVVTRAQESQIANDMATGVDLTFAPMNCAYGGNFTLTATVKSATDNIQVDFNNELSVLLGSAFNDCNLGASNLTGAISLDFNAVLNDLINNNLYQFDAIINASDLWIEQQGYYPFYLNGGLSYSLSSPDGNLITTEISSNNLRYSADSTYQIEEFVSVKIVNLTEQSYSYQLTGSYQEEIGAEVHTVEYYTSVPLQGAGFSLPTDGIVEVYGVDQTLVITVLENQTLLLNLDLDNDGQFDQESYSTWNNLVLSKLGSTN